MDGINACLDQFTGFSKEAKDVGPPRKELDVSVSTEKVGGFKKGVSEDAVVLVKVFSAKAARITKSVKEMLLDFKPHAQEFGRPH